MAAHQQYFFSTQVRNDLTVPIIINKYINPLINWFHNQGKLSIFPRGLHTPSSTSRTMSLWLKITSLRPTWRTWCTASWRGRASSSPAPGTTRGSGGHFTSNCSTKRDGGWRGACYNKWKLVWKTLLMIFVIYRKEHFVYFSRYFKESQCSVDYLLTTLIWGVIWSCFLKSRSPLIVW